MHVLLTKITHVACGWSFKVIATTNLARVMDGTIWHTLWDHLSHSSAQKMLKIPHFSYKWAVFEYFLSRGVAQVVPECVPNGPTHHPS